MERDGLPATIIAGSEYTGFEGAVFYLSGFVIVHRYAYVLLPLEDEPSIVFPSEARYVGHHATTWIPDQVFVPRPGEWLRDRIKDRAWQRIGVYGLEYVMTVRDYQSLAEAGAELVDWEVPFDHARAVKSEGEMESVRESVRINEDGFWAFLGAFEPGKSEAEILASAEQLFVDRGCGRRTMNMVLTGENGRAAPEFKIASTERKIEAGDFVLPSLEVAGSGGHWVEVSRAIQAGGELDDDVKRMAEAYDEYFDAARTTMKEGATAQDVHRTVAKGFLDRGYTLGHVTGHSIGMTMIEFPKIGEGDETVLTENMVMSMHPHAISPDGRSCLYMQDTWRVGKDHGEPLVQIPMRIFDGSESRT